MVLNYPGNVWWFEKSVSNAPVDVWHFHRSCFLSNLVKKSLFVKVWRSFSDDIEEFLLFSHIKTILRCLSSTGLYCEMVANHATLSGSIMTFDSQRETARAAAEGRSSKPQHHDVLSRFAEVG